MTRHAGKLVSSIFLVEDHDAVRETYTLFLDLEEDLEVCGATGTAEEALRLLPETEPDLLLVDISLPGMSGIELVERLRSAGSRVPALVLTGHDTDVYRRGAERAGAEGFVVKQDGPGAVLEAIRRLLGP